MKSEIEYKLPTQKTWKIIFEGCTQMNLYFVDWIKFAKCFTNFHEEQY